MKLAFLTARRRLIAVRDPKFLNQPPILLNRREARRLRKQLKAAIRALPKEAK